ncbi:septum formation family protein [Herbiconiux daphne]|uniref:Septum formation family protein n=1 Tax=Herbiconiux daphne TaxID=2970914 RepID=A0ABT2H258_9MICO|nr:septum formation family protein [Herbiconiux daphne]MCS5734031.1 septum formation family protein [Herbiconiux daphne]
MTRAERAGASRPAVTGATTERSAPAPARRVLTRHVLARRAPALGALALCLGLALAGCTAADSGADGPGAASGSGSTPNAEAQPEQNDTDVFTISVGQCFDDAPGTEVTEVPVVDCGDPHDFEVYADFDLSGDDFPGESDVADSAESGCLDEFEPFVGIAYDDSQYAYSYFAPTERSWSEGDDRLVSCIIGDPDGPVTGSLAGVAE